MASASVSCAIEPLRRWSLERVHIVLTNEAALITGGAA
jgi:hypothetical protein